MPSGKTQSKYCCTAIGALKLTYNIPEDNTKAEIDKEIPM